MSRNRHIEKWSPSKTRKFRRAVCLENQAGSPHPNGDVQNTKFGYREDPAHLSDEFLTEKTSHV